MSARRGGARARVLLLALAASAASRAQDPPPPTAPNAAAPSAVDLASELERAVDAKSAKERRAAAKQLAARKDATLDQWLECARAFGRFLPDEAGSKVHQVELPVLDAVESTELQVYVPKGYTPAEAHPLLLVFHGTGSGGEGLERAWTQVADALSMLVLAPSEAGANEGYAFSPRERAAAHAALRWARRRWNVDEDRIYLTGYSRGGHLAWDLALRSPDRFAAIAPMIGGPRLHALGGQNNLRFAEHLAHLPIRDLQGALDDPGLIFNLKLAFAKLAAAGARDARYIEFPDIGHAFDITAVDWKEFFASARRTSAPASVLRLAVRTDEARAFWAEITRFGKDVAEDIRPKVEAARWNAMSNDDKKKFLQDEADRRTARLAVKRAAPDLYEIEEQHVAALRLLLADELFVTDQPLRVRFRGKEQKQKCKREARVLLEDFVERFDRRYLPVAEVRIGS